MSAQPRNKRGRRAEARAGLVPGAGDQKDARIRELEARVAELEEGGDQRAPENGAGGSDPGSREEMLRESEQRHKVLLDGCEKRLAEMEGLVELQRGQLDDAKQRWRSVLEDSPLAVVEWSAVDYQIRQWSPAAAHVFGWTAEETIGKRIDELNWIHPADRPLVDAAVAALLSGQCSRNVNQHRNVRKDGSVIHCEWFNSALPDPSGGFVVLSLVLDVSARNRAEASLRVADLQLAEAQQRKNEFLTAFAHEVRHPLAPIKNSLHVLGQSADEQARRVQAVIERQVAQLERLAADLLDVTRIARNKLKLQIQRVELNGLVRHAMEEQRALFDKAEVHLEFHPAPRAVLVDADWNRLTQVMANLLENAAKFTGRGGATLVAVHAEKAEQQAAVQVVDTGVGMTPEMVASLFGPLRQADSALDRSRGGLGLGMALVKGLVELHGGQVTVYSAGPGHGTEVTVQLPLLVEEAASVEDGHQSAAKVHRRVLVIEDDIDTGDSLRDLLGFGEHEVEVVRNGPDGIARARESRPEVVLCDVGLLGMDGFEVARAFKADESLKHIVLVALIGDASAENLDGLAQAGFARHLAKPASLEKLEEILSDPTAAGSSEAG